MGIGGISIPQLLIVLVIVVVLFGTKRLGSIGTDLGSAIKGFRKAINEDKKEDGVKDDDTVAVNQEKAKQEEKSQS